MAATTILQIMDGLETRLATIDGLRISEVSPGQVNPPQAIVGVPAIPEYRTTMGRGSYTVACTVIVLTSSTEDRVGQRMLAEFAAPTGARSIAAAIEGDRTLGGVASECWVSNFRSLGLDEVGVLRYFGGVWTVPVTAPGR